MADREQCEALARAQTRAALLNNGVPAAHVDEIVDLGFHAAITATNAILPVIDRAGDQRIWVAALGVALSVTPVLLEAIMDVMKEAAAENGVPVTVVEVGGQAHG